MLDYLWSVGKLPPTLDLDLDSQKVPLVLDPAPAPAPALSPRSHGWGTRTGRG